jgi:hypothetical protein
VSLEDDIAKRYELGRKAGLSHETATDLAAPSDGVKRRPLSGEDWPEQIEAPAAGTDTTSYTTKEELTVDGAMWLRKAGIALSVHPANFMAWRIGNLFTSKGYPVIENVRVSGAAKDQGFINLDMRVRYSEGGRGIIRYKSLRVPIGVCNGHDTTWLIANLLEYLTGSRVDLAFMKDLTMSETDLRHVHGAH